MGFTSGRLILVIWTMLALNTPVLSSPSRTRTAESGLKKLRILWQSDPVLLIEKHRRPVDEAIRYDLIDAHALGTPAATRQSVAGLSAYLTQPACNEFEKVRAVYRWITANIDYDVESYFKTRNHSPDAGHPLRSGKAVCAGYSGLFTELLQHCGIQCMEISGYAKGYSYETGELPAGSNHSWNAVSIEGRWYLIDPTWGSGYIDSERCFKRQFEDFYFCPPPELLIMTHLPDEPRYQFIDPPLTSAEFVQLAKPWPIFFKQGFHQCVSLESLLEADSLLIYRFRTSQPTSILADLTRDGQKLSKTQTFIQTENGFHTVYVRFPATGTYLFELFARPLSDTDAYQIAMKCQIQTRNSCRTIHPFPITYPSFTPSMRLHTPLRGQLPANTICDFRVTVPEVASVAVYNADHWHHLIAQADTWYGSVRVIRGELHVMIKYHPGDTAYWRILTWQVQ